MRRPRQPANGMTLLEILVILALVAALLGIFIPQLLDLIYRYRLEGIVRETAVVMQSARLQAIKTGNQGVVAIDSSTRQVAGFVDADEDRAIDLTERRLGLLFLPAGIGFQGPGGQPAIDGFQTSGNEGYAVFNSDGGTEAPGAFRIADERGNFLEVRIMNLAGRIEVRKWDGGGWFARDEGGKPWKWN